MTFQQEIDPSKLKDAQESYYRGFFAKRGVAPGDAAPRDVPFDPTGSGVDWTNTRTSDSMTFTDLKGNKRKETETWTPGNPFDTVTGEDGKPMQIFNQWTARDNETFHPFGQEIAAERMASVGQKDYFQLRADLFDSQKKAADLQVSLMEQIRTAGSKGSAASKYRA